MNYKLVLVSALLAYVPIQSAPESPTPTSSSSRTQGVWPWVAAAVVGSGCVWAYRRLSPPSTPEELADQAAMAFKDCLKTNREPLNSHGFPSECTGVALAYAFAREKALDAPKEASKVQHIIDSFKEFSTVNPD